MALLKVMNKSKRRRVAFPESTKRHLSNNEERRIKEAYTIFFDNSACLNYRLLNTAIMSLRGLFLAFQEE